MKVLHLATIVNATTPIYERWNLRQPEVMMYVAHYGIHRNPLAILVLIAIVAISIVPCTFLSVKAKVLNLFSAFKGYNRLNVAFSRYFARFDCQIIDALSD